MMKIVLAFMLFTISALVNAQDTIYKRSGDIIPAKVLEINIKDLSYKRADLLDGPLFIINKNEIHKIKYATGELEYFKISNETQKTQPIVFVTPIQPLNYNQICHALRRGTYYYQRHFLSDRNVLFLVQERNLVWKNLEIQSNIKDAKRNKNLQYLIGYGGAFIGGTGLYASALSADAATNGAAIAALGAILSAGIVVSSQIVSFSYKLKRVKNSDKVADLYNQLSKN